MASAAMLITDGTNFVNPSEAFKKLEPITSKIMAMDRYRYFIL